MTDWSRELAQLEREASVPREPQRVGDPCMVCGEPTPRPRSGGTVRKTCSDACKRVRQRHLDTERRRGVRKPRYQGAARGIRRKD